MFKSLGMGGDTSMGDRSPCFFLCKPGTFSNTASSVAPVGVLPPIPASAKTMSGLPSRWGEPEELAKAVLFLASEDSSYINAVELMVDGGATGVPFGAPILCG
jgi:NAD(P)-dependent dehydrogenase (short-subunit alcohol dehydrogenase family)